MTLSPRRTATIHHKDQRIKHLVQKSNLAGGQAKKPCFMFQGGLIDYTDYIVECLRVRPGVVYVYNFDGEMDDQIRLEHLLLQWPRQCNLVVVAGQRIGGDDTYQEMASVVKQTLGEEISPCGISWTHPYIRLMHGGPLFSPKTSDDSRMLEQAVQHIRRAIGRRPFVYHENSSSTALAALLDTPVASQLEATTATCDIVALPSGFKYAANRNRNEAAWRKVVDYCRNHKKPFVSMHGSLAGWKMQVLPELPTWGETMLRPATDASTAEYLRKMIRQGIAFALWAAFVGYGAANSLTCAQVQEYAHNTIRKAALLPSKPVKPSDDWIRWSTDPGLNGWSYAQAVDQAASLFRGMAANNRTPLSNTVGDLAGMPFDVPQINRKKLVLLKIEGWRGEQAVLGGKPYAASGGHYILAYTGESSTLLKGWDAVRKHRGRQADPGAIPLLDKSLAAEWAAYRSLAEPLLQAILANIAKFPANLQARQHVQAALHNLEYGEMTKASSDILNSHGRYGSSRKSSRQSSLV